LLGVETGGLLFICFVGADNSEVIMQIQTAAAPAILATVNDSTLYFHQIWPPVVIALGLGLSAAWASLLGYGLIELVSLAF
jgi:hypothetical protein